MYKIQKSTLYEGKLYFRYNGKGVCIYIYIYIYKIFGEFHAKRVLLWRFSVAGNNKIQ
jgi:hypothetical protein